MKFLFGAGAAGLALALFAWNAGAAGDGVVARTGGKNLPPVACFGPNCQQSGFIKILKCDGVETTFELDASLSFDPEGQPLTFLWSSSPGSTIDDVSAPTTTLRIDTSMLCDRIVGVRVRVSDGQTATYARLFLEVIENVPICGDRPRKIEMVYTGEGCWASNYVQDPSGVGCTGDPVLASPVRILVTMLHQEDRVYFDGIVELGESFEMDGEGQPSGKVPPNSHIQIFDLEDNVLQDLHFHTSCSQPLEVGDQFGAVILTGFTP